MEKEFTRIFFLLNVGKQRYKVIQYRRHNNGPMIMRYLVKHSLIIYRRPNL